MSTLRLTFGKAMHILADFGFYPIQFFIAARGIPAFIYDFVRFSSRYSGRLCILPSLRDRYEAAGSVSSEYFLQDLFVAQQIQCKSPSSILDMGSRLDGFVAHIASQQLLDVIDVRPLPHNIHNINFVCLDISSPFHEQLSKQTNLRFAKYDIITCLHALEHVGLGRYGDRLDPYAYVQALTNLVSLLDTDGCFWLSVPIGRPRIEFNSHQIFSINIIQSTLNDLSCHISRAFKVKTTLSTVEEISLDDFASLSNLSYTLCIFEIKKDS